MIIHVTPVVPKTESLRRTPLATIVNMTENLYTEMGRLPAGHSPEHSEDVSAEVAPYRPAAHCVHEVDSAVL